MSKPALSGSELVTSATPKPHAGEHVPEGQFSGHTPGPWHWDCDPVKGDPTGRVRYRVCALGKTITQVYYSSFEGGPTSAEADARLIAFAPDLLAERDSLRERERGLAQWLAVVLDQVDYTAGACSPTNMVGACLDSSVIEKARAALKHGR